jgi:hypothetical protein
MDGEWSVRGKEVTKLVGDGVSRVGLAWCGVKCWELMMLAVEKAIRDRICNMIRLGYGVWTVCA